MKIRIKSDGLAWGTSVLVVDDDGNETALDGVLAVEWKIETEGVATAILRMETVEVDVDAQAVKVPAEAPHRIREGVV